jgi:glycosyltransferase involved in cell wall biosynthesis
MDISVVVPVKNERDNIRPLATLLDRYRLQLAGQQTRFREAIIVNDRSDDGTDKELQACSLEYPWLRAITLRCGVTGKGAALKEGFRLATGDIIVMMDGDMQHSPFDIPRIIAPLLEDRADIVVAARRDFRLSVWRHFLSTGLGLIFSFIFALHLATPNEGFKAMLAKPLSGIEVEPSGFEFDLELLVKAKARGFRIEQVDIPVYERIYGESKVNTLRTVCLFAIKMVQLRVARLQANSRRTRA